MPRDPQVPLQGPGSLPPPPAPDAHSPSAFTVQGAPRSCCRSETLSRDLGGHRVSCRRIPTSVGAPQSGGYFLRVPGLGRSSTGPPPPPSREAFLALPTAQRRVAWARFPRGGGARGQRRRRRGTRLRARGTYDAGEWSTDRGGLRADGASGCTRGALPREPAGRLALPRLGRRAAATRQPALRGATASGARETAGAQRGAATLAPGLYRSFHPLATAWVSDLPSSRANS